jgi:uncharacterized membrane protein HdeD (DUF308 family)
MTDQVSRTELDAAIMEARLQLAESWGWFLALGIILLLAGGAAIVFPLVFTVAAKIMLGWIFLVGGVVLVVHALSTRAWTGFFWNLLIGLLYVVAGGWLAFFPFTGIITLTVLLAALFLAEGALEVMLAFRVRPHEGWGWLLLSGLVAVAVGLLIAYQLPGSAVWAIGLLVGVNLISTGASFVVLALAGRRARAA